MSTCLYIQHAFSTCTSVQYVQGRRSCGGYAGRRPRPQSLHWRALSHSLRFLLCSHSLAADPLVMTRCPHHHSPCMPARPCSCHDKMPPRSLHAHNSTVVAPAHTLADVRAPAVVADVPAAVVLAFAADPHYLSRPWLLPRPPPLSPSPASHFPAACCTRGTRGTCPSPARYPHRAGHRAGLPPPAAPPGCPRHLRWRLPPRLE